MTTYDGVPTMATFLSMKLANRISRSRSKELRQPMNSVRTWVNAFVRLVAHLAGFSLLTWAGFTWNMTAGLIVAGLSCFMFAWLMNDSAPVTTTQPANRIDPMASRR